MIIVTLLTRPDCRLCEHAKQVLATVGADYPLQVEEISIDSDHGIRLAATAGVMFAPGVLLDGRPFAFGRLSERALRRELHRSTTQETE
ncbi:MAG: thioredoxin family protein [Acidimicrobiales bacterium]|nr:MAG: thioredoxin family protein [Acidimicrobiales bacterium]